VLPRLTAFLIIVLAICSRSVYGGFRVNTLVAKGPSKTSAVVIGIGRYSDPSLAALHTPERDARDVFAALTDPSTGLADSSTSVLLLGSQATRASILTAVREHQNRLKEDEALIIYFSGHSTPYAASNDILLFPYDVREPYRESAIALDADLLNEAPNNADLIFIGDGCNIGAGFTEGISAAHPRVGVLSASKFDEYALDETNGRNFSTALISTLRSGASDLDGDGFISLEEAFVSLYPMVVSSSFAKQHPTLAGARVHRLMLARAPLPENSVFFDLPLPDDISTSDKLVINGTSVKVDLAHSAQDKLVLLGNGNGLIGRGMTYLETAKHQYLYWRESEKLQRFQNPYNTSFAVLVAIDDYDRTNDPLHRGKTGYEPRGFMVQRAEELHASLKRLGFPEDHIITLYNDRATSGNVEKTLITFWKGGAHETADRVFFYFGGHGDTFDGSGVLITYDFDRQRPTSTGFLMRDLVTRHSENMTTHQVLFALDACASGLAVYKTLGPPSATAPKEFQQLSIIRNDVEPKARNFLVAGTADQPALWDNGGVFTQALIAGLDGKADLNNDRLIQLTELYTYVSDEVARRAAEKNVRQQVEEFNLDAVGTGKVVFIEQNASLTNGPR